VALQVAALQQQLMVAALTCDDVSLYNSFVITYQKDLVTSDGALQAFFDRFGSEEGTPAYHSFKTKMANVYSARSATDKKRFCENARAAFGPALKTEKMSLASFAMSQPSTVNEPYTNCGESVAGGAMVARTPAVAPLPPRSNVLTAQNAAAEAKRAAASAPPAADKPLSAALRTNPPPAPGPTTAGSAAVAAAGANAAAPSGSQAANSQTNPERSVTRSAQNPYYQGYGTGYARERERLAQQQRAAEQANASTAAAGSAAAAAGANAAAPSSGQAANSGQNQERSVTRSAQGRYDSQAYRDRLAQQRAARQRAAEQAGVRYRDRYEARGYYWPADPYWQYCYTRYGVRMTCSEAAARFRSNQFYYRAPYDAWGYSPSR
jgi:hypothetical protein